MSIIKDIINLFILSIPIVVCYLYASQVIQAVKQKRQPKHYWLEALIAILATLFALWYYGRLD